MGRDRSAWGLNRLERPTLRKQQQNAVSTDIIGPHAVVLIDAGQTKNVAIEGRSLLQVGDVQGGLKNSVEPGHPWSSLPLLISTPALETSKDVDFDQR
jgi:hypothetical protein